ncbi:MAG: LysR family transcriptional regulator [Burkholderiaceae bacterium]
MERDLLVHLPVVLAVAQRGGFAAASASLGMTASAVSHAVRQVEERIGQPLFARTTRSVALTEAGRTLVAAISPALADIGDGLDRVRSIRGRASGHLRINAPRIAVPMALAEIAAEMAVRHPDVTLEIVADDALSDIVELGFDAGVRLGSMVAKDMVAVALTPPFRVIMVASPAYLARRGTPADIAALPLHNCIGFRQIRSGGIYAWEVRQRGRETSVTTSGSAIITDPLQARDLALAGVGIGYIFEPLVRADLAAGRLVAVLPDAAIEEPGLFLYFPKRASLAPKLRACVDVARHLREQS